MRLRLILLGCALALGVAQSGATQPASRASAAAPAAEPLAAFNARIEATKQAMMGDPVIARRTAESAVAMARTMESDSRVSARDAAIATATANWLLGEALIGLNEPARAKPVIAQALAAATRAAPRSKLNGDLLRSRATLSEMSGDVQGALKDYLRAYEIFRAVGQPRSEAIALQDVGNLYLEAGDFERVRRYYSQSIDAFDEDPWLNLATYNNRGQSYREEGKFVEAEAEYRLALDAARKLDSPLLEARILTNLADAQIDAGRVAPALQTIAAAGRLSGSGEAAGWRPYVLGVRAKIEARRGDFAAAARLFSQAFAGQNLAQTQMPFRDLHRAAADVYERLGRQALALEHFKAFERLEREGLKLTSSTSSQLMSARFDYANQNLRIAKLKQGQLQRDVMIERQRTQFRTNLFIGIAAALLVIFAMLLFGYVSIRRSRDQVRAANSELSAANVALETALQARTDFLATTSHEIRTPLNGILGMTQVLLTDRRLPSDVRERIGVVLGAGETMKTLVDDILDVAKMEAGGLDVELAEINLSKVLQEVVDFWRETAVAKGLTFACTLDAVPERVLGNGERLKQILSNLLSNAIKFTPQGGVDLTVRGTDGRVAFAVGDTGIGIAPEDQAAIFEAFTQVNNSTTRAFSGTGLGLAISRRLALALGGDIAVASEPGEGACFTLSLPLESVGDGLASIDRPAGSGAQRLGEAALLVVDANPANHALLRMLLSPETRSIDVVGSVEEAAERIAEHGVDHVVVEGGAADLAGIRALVAQAREAGARTSLLAAPDAEHGAAAMFALGAGQVILKPIGAADLIAALRTAYATEPEGAPAFAPMAASPSGARR